MPIYEFICRKCDAEFEELFGSFAEKRKTRCPECGSVRTEKQFSTFAMSTGRSSDSSSGSGCSSCHSHKCSSCKCKG